MRPPIHSKGGIYMLIYAVVFINMAFVFLAKVPQVQHIGVDHLADSICFRCSFRDDEVRQEFLFA
jgi:hypothetical protein